MAQIFLMKSLISCWYAGVLFLKRRISFNVSVGFSGYGCCSCLNSRLAAEYFGQNMRKCAKSSVSWLQHGQLVFSFVKRFRSLRFRVLPCWFYNQMVDGIRKWNQLCARGDLSRLSRLSPGCNFGKKSSHEKI